MSLFLSSGVHSRSVRTQVLAFAHDIVVIHYQGPGAGVTDRTFSP